MSLIRPWMMTLLWAFPAFVLVVSAASPAAFGQSGTAAPKDPRIFMIGHAHIDPVWRWTKDEGQAEVLATFRSALARMREYPDVAFVSSSAQFYKWVQDADPSMFAEIRQRVREGRWNVVGGWWVEPDLNCPLGESLVRQGLYGQLFFEKNLGVKARVGFNPDSFGHPWTLPQILAGQELSAYVFMRPSPTEKPDLKAPLFLWQAPDGTKIPTIQILGSYNGTELDIENQIETYRKRFGETLPGAADWAVFYGVGNHGGGPTIAAIEKIKALQKSAFPGMRFSTLDSYAAAVQLGTQGWPVVSDELQHHARGCYSVTAEVKKWNRASEWALLSAEKAAAYAAAVFGGSYPAERFQRAWEKVLFNQFHDILAGSAIEQAYVDARNDFGFALSEAKDIGSGALQWIARHLDTASASPARSAPFLVFNPLSWAASVPIEVEMQRAEAAAPSSAAPTAGKSPSRNCGPPGSRSATGSGSPSRTNIRRSGARFTPWISTGIPRKKRPAASRSVAGRWRTRLSVWPSIPRPDRSCPISTRRAGANICAPRRPLRSPWPMKTTPGATIRRHITRSLAASAGPRSALSKRVRSADGSKS
jgi:alpha-mannosidase